MLVGLDLGSRYLGVVVASATLPLRIIDSATPEVDRHDLDATARMLRALVDKYAPHGLPPDVVVELGAFYPPKGATPQQIVAMAENHKTMERLLDRIHEALPGPFYRVVTIARRTWSSRVVPHHKGGVSNAEANAGLPTWLDPAGAWPKLSDQHRRDACGACIGYLLGAPKREPRPTKGKRKRKPYKPRPKRPPTARELALLAHDARADALLEEAQSRLARPAQTAGPTLAESRAALAALPPIGYSGRR